MNTIGQEKLKEDFRKKGLIIAAESIKSQIEKTFEPEFKEHNTIVSYQIENEKFKFKFDNLADELEEEVKAELTRLYKV